MADLEIFSPRPHCYRINHPDLGDVCQTTYAKGVITEFMKLRDDPVKVESLVKVEIEGREFDGYLPLFYHPKPLYWDDEERQATDFNQEGRYFDKAWMSFRGGDEVAVMLKEGEPAAVIGFADGIPRIGEDVFRLEYEKWNGEKHSFHFQASKEWAKYVEMDEDATGPDGLDLGLDTEALRLCATKVAMKHTNGVTGGSVWHETNTYRQYLEFLIRLGGRAFILQVLNSHQFTQTWMAFAGPGGEIIIGPHLEDYWTYMGFHFSILAAPDNRDLIEAAIQLGKNNSKLNAIAIYEGDYCRDPEQRWYVDYPGFAFQPGCFSNFYALRALFPFAWMGRDIVNGATIRIFVRPHTKEEMIAAGVL